MLLCELQCRALALARVRQRDDDLGAFARERRLLFTLLQLVRGLLQFVARDEALFEQRLQLLVLQAQPLDPLVCQLQARARLRHRERAFAFRHAGERRLGLAPLDVCHLNLQLRLTDLLMRAFELALQLRRVEPDEQVAFVHQHAFGCELGDLGFAPGERRPIGNGLRWPEDAGRGEARGERPFTDERGQRWIDCGTPPEGTPGEEANDYCRDADREMWHSEFGIRNSDTWQLNSKLLIPNSELPVSRSSPPWWK